MPRKEAEEGTPQSQILWGTTRMELSWFSSLCCFESLLQVVLCTNSYG